MDFLYYILFFSILFFNVLFIVTHRKRYLLELVFKLFSFVFFFHFYVASFLLAFDSFSYTSLCLMVFLLDVVALIFEHNNETKEKNFNRSTRIEYIIILLFFFLLLVFVYSRSEDIRTSSDMGMYFERYNAFFHGFEGKYVSLKELGTINDNVDQCLIQDAGLGVVERGNNILFAYQGIQTWPTIMIPFGKIFGLTQGTFALTVFYYLAVLSIYLFLEKKTGNDYSKWCGCILYALSPVIMYLAKSTFTESIFGPALLIGLYFISKENIFEYIYGAFWIGIGGFLHISMFLYIFPFVFALMYMFWFTKKKKYLYIHASLVLLHIVSLYYCLSVSQVYSREQLGRFFFISSNPYVIILVFLLAEVLTVVVSKSCNREKSYLFILARYFMESKWKYLSMIMISVIVIGAKYYTYIICMTNDLEIGKPDSTWKLRAEYIGTGISALAHVNFYNFLMCTSLLSLPLIFVKIIKGKSLAKWQKALFLILFFSMFLYTFIQVDTPKNYYASRYFSPTIIPLICILVSSLIDKRLAIMLSLFSLIFNIRYDYYFINESSFSGQYNVVNLAYDSVPCNSIVVIDKDAGELEKIIQDNLRMTRNCYVYPGNCIDDVINYYEGEDIYYISSHSVVDYEIDDLLVSGIKLIDSGHFDITYNLGGINGRFLSREMDKYIVDEYIYKINVAK